MTISGELFGIGFILALATIVGLAIRAQNKLFKEIDDLVKAHINDHAKDSTAHKDIRESIDNVSESLRNYISEHRLEVEKAAQTIIAEIHKSRNGASS